MIVSESELVAAVTRDHAAGKRIGLVRTRFDLVRVDLVRAIQAAAARSDRVVVAVIDDGGAAPISAQDRAELVDGFRGVDYVIICPKDSVDRLAGALAPDFP